MDPGFDENEPELGILILAVPLQMLPDADGLLDQVVDVLGQIRSQTLRLQDAQDLVSGDEPDLSHAMTVPENDTDLRRGQSLLGQLEDLVLDIVRGQLEPIGDRSAIWQGGLGNTLSRCVHATHGEFKVVSAERI